MAICRRWSNTYIKLNAAIKHRLKLTELMLWYSDCARDHRLRTAGSCCETRRHCADAARVSLGRRSVVEHVYRANDARDLEAPWGKRRLSLAGEQVGVEFVRHIAGFENTHLVA